MKSRTGFVSNSSSTSFIIAIKNDSKFKLEKFMKYVERGDGETSIRNVGADEIKEKIKEDYRDYDYEDGRLSEYGNKLLKEIDALPPGYTVYKLNVDYCDGGTTGMIYYMASIGEFIIVKDHN